MSGIGGMIGQAGMEMFHDAWTARQAQLWQEEQSGRGRRWSERMTDEARQFEMNMSNTEVQRRAADLKAAGFNPMLSFMKGEGASTPSVSAASSGFSGPPVSMGRASPMAAMQSAAQIRNMEADTKLKMVQAGQSGAQTSVLQQDVEKVKAQIGEINSQADLHRAQSAMLGLEFKKLMEVLPALIAEIKAKSGRAQLGSDTVKGINENEKSFYDFLEYLGSKIGEGAWNATEWYRMIKEDTRLKKAAAMKGGN